MNISLQRNSLSVYLDGPTTLEIDELGSLCDGFTFNPTLFRSLGVANYLEHCELLAEKEKTKPISFEVIADEYDGMMRQARLLASLGRNIWVKIPALFCNGESTKRVIADLQNEGISVNVTAVFSLEQIKGIAEVLNKDSSIISVFAGRIYDLGLDAKLIVAEIVKWNSENLQSKILWASPRMVFDIISANQVHCDIITVPPNILIRKKLWGKSPEDYSRETVQMFYKDASKSGFAF
jgi:transaldolase